MEVVAKSDFLRISPRKLNLVAQSIKGLKVTYALEVLKNLNKKAAKFLILTLKQGLGNAKNNFNLSNEDLIIKNIQVGKGIIIKRGKEVSRGQFHQILKRTSNLKIYSALLLSLCILFSKMLFYIFNSGSFIQKLPFSKRHR